MADKFWDRHLDTDRVEFARYLAPLVTAARDRKFSKAEASIYLLTLQDVPRDILALGVSKLLEQGITWMPKPGDIKHVCCDIVDERRAEAHRHAQALLHCDACQADHCPDCHGSHWQDAEGPNAVIECPCKARVLELMRVAGQALPRPALPASSESEVTA